MKTPELWAARAATHDLQAALARYEAAMCVGLPIGTRVFVRGTWIGTVETRIVPPCGQLIVRPDNMTSTQLPEWYWPKEGVFQVHVDELELAE